MNQVTMTSGKERPDPTSNGKSRASDSAFDRWLNRGLHELFDDVMKEPIPPQLLDILQKAQKRDDEPKTGGETADKKVDDPGR